MSFSGNRLLNAKRYSTVSIRITSCVALVSEVRPHPFFLEPQELSDAKTNSTTIK